ncbi:MAG: metal ABC transporter substrate-binding protein [Planctomycetaceae bacterium]|nr:metal ABC transporter substrate-binding protein [Planctomycetaceae bacterium]
MTARLLCCGIMLAIGIGCGRSAQPASEEGPSTQSSGIVVTSRVMQQFAVAVYGDTASVSLIDVSPGESRVPDRESLQQLQSAQLVIWHGAGFEPWRDMVSLPSGRQRDLSDDLQERLLTTAGAVAHQHGPDGAQRSADHLWAVWVDPDLALLLLQSLQNVAAGDADPAAAPVAQLAAQLQKLGDRADLLALHPRRVMIADEQLNYLVRRLGWQTVAVDPQATVEDLVDCNADLLLSAESSGQTVDPRNVGIDLCLADSSSIVEALTGNFDRLQQAVEATAESAAAR